MSKFSRAQKLAAVCLSLIFITGLAIGLIRSGKIHLPAKPTALNRVPDVVTETTESTSAFADLSKPELGNPIKLHIEKLGMNLDIVKVGKAKDGFMETPKYWNQAGWYSLSMQTAQQGNIIINGHYDDNYGRPAAFWQLKKVELGDKVTLVDEFNRPFDYEVTDIYYLAIDDPNRFKIFNVEKGKQLLTLITCGGVWLPGESTYNKRLIVKAERIN